MNVGDRVRFKDKPFLSDGYILKVIHNRPFSSAYVIKLDKKAPNEYAWKTDEVLSFGRDIEVIK